MFNLADLAHPWYLLVGQVALGFVVRPHLQRFFYWFEGYLEPGSSWRWSK